MKKFIYSVLIVCLLASCSHHEDKNVRLIESYVQAVENFDSKTLESLLDDGYIGYGPSYGDSINKVDAIANWETNISDLYENIHYERSRNIAVSVPDGENAGDWVSNWAELTITYQGDIGEVTIWANSIYKIENGKIVKSFTFYNEADALRQLGFTYSNIANP